jgi:hypothetical protein
VVPLGQRGDGAEVDAEPVAGDELAAGLVELAAGTAD